MEVDMSTNLTFATGGFGKRTADGGDVPISLWRADRLSGYHRLCLDHR
jgi:hypothetical protein